MMADNNLANEHSHILERFKDGRDALCKVVTDFLQRNEEDFKGRDVDAIIEEEIKENTALFEIGDEGVNHIDFTSLVIYLSLFGDDYEEELKNFSIKELLYMNLSAGRELNNIVEAIKSGEIPDENIDILESARDECAYLLAGIMNAVNENEELTKQKEKFSANLDLKQQEFLESPETIAIIADIKGVWNDITNEERVMILQPLVTAYNEYLGFDDIKLVLVNDTEHDICACYSFGKDGDSIKFNIANPDFDEVMENPDDVISTIVHEMRHRMHDDKERKATKAGWKNADDNLLCMQLLVNRYAGIDSGMNSYLRSQWDFGINFYEGQFTEQDAFSAEDKAKMFVSGVKAGKDITVKDIKAKYPKWWVKSAPLLR